MILFEICGTEDHPAYERLAVTNLNRQYDLLRSLVMAALETNRICLSQTVIRALNFHAIACLHTNAGEFRPTKVYVGDYEPPDHYRVQALMDDFINEVNTNWTSADPIELASYILWKLNWIHPFINGNGRTARVACYYALCLKVGGWLAGDTLLPELIRRERTKADDRYTAALKAADASIKGGGPLDLTDMHNLLSELLAEQMKSTPNKNPPARAP